MARIATLLLALVVVAIVVAADRASLPGFVRALYAFPGGDKAGHAVLFGGLAFLATLAFPRRVPVLRTMHVPLAAVVVALLVTLEEASQARFPGRTLSLADLAASCAGIAVGAAPGAALGPRPSVRARRPA